MSATQKEIKARYISLARYIAESMVAPEDREAVAVKGSWDRGQLTLEVSVPDTYRGLFIGRNGHMVRSLRTLMGLANLDLPGAVAFEIA